MRSVNSRIVWILYFVDGWNQYVVEKTTEYNLEYSDYYQGLQEQYNVTVYYDPRILQKVVIALEGIGYDIREI